MGVRRGRSEAWERLRSVAGEQAGVFSLEQAKAAGLSRVTVWRAADLLCAQVHWGVYRYLDQPVTYEQRLHAAVLSRPAAWVSHRSAARLHGLDLGSFDSVELTERSPSGRAAPGLIIHQSRGAPDLAHRVRGLPVTGLVQTLAELAQVLRVEPLAVSVEEAWYRRLVSPSHLEHALSRQSGAHGVPELRKVLEDCRVRGRPMRSALEVRAWWALKEAGMPLPIPGLQFSDAHGQPGEIDFAYPDRRIAIEANGFRFHSDRAAFQRDATRSQRLAALGWSLFPVTWSHVMKERTQWLRRLREALSSRRRVAAPWLEAVS